MHDIIGREYRSVPHEGRLYSRLVMSTSIRNAILERNKRLRADSGAPLRDLPGIGRLALSIPALDWEHIRKKYPELESTDGQTKRNAIIKFVNSSDSLPYKVR
jgi:hypothetical protein